METNNEKIKKLINKKIVLGVGAMFSMIAIVSVISIFPFIIDFSNLFTSEWWSDEIILIVICIYSVICVMFIGQASNSQDARSEIAKAKVKFNYYFKDITRNTFEQWVKNVLEPRDQKAVYDRVLRLAGIKQFDILDLPRKDIKSLINMPQRIENKWYDEITEEQYNEIIKIKDGKYNIKFVDAGYYLTDKHIDAIYTRSEIALREQTKKSLTLMIRLVFKITMVLITSIIIGMFAKDVLTEQDTATSLMKLFSRLMTICSSSFVGYMTGCQENDINASYIDMKAETMKEQLSDTNFKAKSVEEIAKEKYTNIVKEELANARKDKENNNLLGFNGTLHNI